ncbi:MAG: hypothetical protein CSA34_06835 [Desulfobulbus propionicus]|nr:MAG: hypothetical protein CSA34_06835 [Desulfobulbus propionicus]
MPAVVLILVQMTALTRNPFQEWKTADLRPGYHGDNQQLHELLVTIKGIGNIPALIRMLAMAETARFTVDLQTYSTGPIVAITLFQIRL